HFGRSVRWEKSKQWDRAREAIGRAIAIAPRVARFHVQLGNLELRLGDRGAAERTFKHALGLQPDTAILPYMIGLHYLEQGFSEEAERHFRQSIKNDDTTMQHAMLGLAYLAR